MVIIEEKKIKQLLLRLLKKSISREEAQNQAIEIRELFDNGRIKIYPEKDEDKIWDAVQYIELYAEKIDESTYLYSEQDLLNYIMENGWKIKE